MVSSYSASPAWSTRGSDEHRQAHKYAEEGRGENEKQEPTTDNSGADDAKYDDDESGLSYGYDCFDYDSDILTEYEAQVGADKKMHHKRENEVQMDRMD